MPVSASQRLRDEGGFTMLVALIMLTVSSLLIAAAFVAAKGDIGNTQHDLDAKRAYSAARAGLANFLVQLNRNTELWETCPSKGSTQVPGGADEPALLVHDRPGERRARVHHRRTRWGRWSTSPPASFRMKFTGTSGTPAVTRTIVAAFRRDSPLDFLWYSVYETLDPNTYADPASKQDCAEFLRDGRPSDCGVISWITNDRLNGPMYTQDQYSICGAPVFGRAGRQRHRQHRGARAAHRARD